MRSAGDKAFGRDQTFSRGVVASGLPSSAHEHDDGPILRNAPRTLRTALSRTTASPSLLGVDVVLALPDSRLWPGPTGQARNVGTWIQLRSVACRSTAFLLRPAGRSAPSSLPVFRYENASSSFWHGHCLRAVIFQARTLLTPIPTAHAIGRFRALNLAVVTPTGRRTPPSRL